MPLLIVTGDIKENNSLWAPSNIAAFLFVNTISLAINQDIHLYIDGKEVAVFEKYGRIETTLTSGTHTIKAKYQNLSTLEFSFDMSQNENEKKIFCIGNSNFKQKMNIVFVIAFAYLFLFLFLFSFYPNINEGLLFVPILGILLYNLIAIKRHSVIDITEMWNEYD